MNYFEFYFEQDLRVVAKILHADKRGFLRFLMEDLAFILGKFKMIG